MIVALDAQLALGTATGIGEYVRGLAAALRGCEAGVIELDDPHLDPWRFDRRVLWDQVFLPRRARASGADVLHCASGTMPIRSPLPTVVTVHDVAWLKVQLHTRPYARYYFGAFALARYRNARGIAVDSEFSRGELLDVLNVPGDRVRVIFPGVADDFCTLQRSAVCEPIVLVPGTVEWRKNVEVLVRALPALPHVCIVCVGPFTPYKDACARLARDLGVADRIEFRGYVAREELLRLYASCSLVAVPSVYEGFGYAAAQALCAGVPVIVSDRSSLPEIAAGDAAVASAGDPKQWAHAMSAILSDPQSAAQRAGAARARARAFFSWAAAARDMLRLYESAVKN